MFSGHATHTEPTNPKHYETLGRVLLTTQLRSRHTYTSPSEPSRNWSGTHSSGTEHANTSHPISCLAIIPPQWLCPTFTRKCNPLAQKLLARHTMINTPVRYCRLFVCLELLQVGRCWSHIEWPAPLPADPLPRIYALLSREASTYQVIDRDVRN